MSMPFQEVPQSDRRRSVSLPAIDDPAAPATKARATEFIRVACCIGVAAGALAGCGAGGSGNAGGIVGRLQDLKPLADKCDGNEVNLYGALDLSATGRDPTIIARRVEAFYDEAKHTAACMGYVKIVAFSGSESDTVVLGENEFSNGHGTTNARLNDAGKKLDELFAEVKKAIPGAERDLSTDGTDVLPQLELAHEFQAARHVGRLRIALGTDGVATTGPVVMNIPGFTMRVALSAGQRVPVAELKQAKVRIFGIGEVRGKKPPSWFTDAVKAFYGEVCRRSGADHDYQVTTNYTEEA
jgi:hypothetical protein